MISPLASVDSTAKIGKNVTIQPFAYIERDVEIGDDCVIMSNASILKGTRLGKGNKVHHGAVLGSEPQDFHYTGEESRLIIGDNNDIRENVVISRATHESGCTRIGDNNYLMDGVHLCHDASELPHRQLGIDSGRLPHCKRCAALYHYEWQPGRIPWHQCNGAPTQASGHRPYSAPYRKCLPPGVSRKLQCTGCPAKD